MSAGGDTEKGLAAITNNIQTLKTPYRFYKDSKDNAAKIERFTAQIARLNGGKY